MDVKAGLMQLGWSEKEYKVDKKGDMEKNQKVMGTVKERNQGKEEVAG